MKSMRPACGSALALVLIASGTVAWAAGPAGAITTEITQPPQTTRMVTVSSDGAQEERQSHSAAVSEDGRFVTFSSRGRHFVAGERIGGQQIYVRDMSTGITVLVSRGRDGGGGNQPSGYPSISADGTRVTFESAASNLVRGDRNGLPDVFLVELGSTQKTTMLSRAADGTPGDRGSSNPVISADGSHVVFTSSANNLVAGSGEYPDIFVRDLESRTTELITQTPGGGPTNYYSYKGWISGDGQRVSYWSGASNLVGDDTNNRDDIFLYDAATGDTTLISRTPDGEPATGDSADSALSDDGRWLTYFSYATDLVQDDVNNLADVFLYDIAAGTTKLISRAGAPANGDSAYPSISGDGRLVTYTSWADNLVAGDLNGAGDVFVYDASTATTTLITHGRDGGGANGPSTFPAISADGTRVAYESKASNVVQGDTDVRGGDDVFLYRR